MDLDLALWCYNPNAQYLLTADKTAIAAWRSADIPRPTPAQLQAAWTQAQSLLAAQANLATLQQQHSTALATIRTTLIGNATKTANDITAVENFIAALEADTAPTAAQLVQTIRFLLRERAVRAG